MPTSAPPPFPSASSNTASWHLQWAQRLSWLISALSGTMEIEAEHEQRMRELEQENVKLDEMILQTNKESERLAALEPKINSKTFRANKLKEIKG